MTSFTGVISPWWTYHIEKVEECHREMTGKFSSFLNVENLEQITVFVSSLRTQHKQLLCTLVILNSYLYTVQILLYKFGVS